ncbi:MAG: tetratricopeptide repeat protein [Prevotella sp.]|nr:tetratricopeptide repeat protein [Prevotella sp.]
MRLRYFLLCIMALCAFSLASAQSVKDMRRYVKRGNRMMHAGERGNAMGQYKKAYEIDSMNPTVNYNLGTSMFEAEWKVMKPDTLRDSVMVKTFLRAGDPLNEPNALRRAMAYHNLGVMYQSKANQSSEQEKTQALQQAIEAYKQALRNNPHDDETRYNLVLCQRQLPKGGGNDNNNNQQQDNKDDQKQDNQQQQQPDSLQQPPPQHQQQQQQQQDQSKQEMLDQLLNIAEQNEKRTKENVDQHRQDGQRHSNQKNW